MACINVESAKSIVNYMANAYELFNNDYEIIEVQELVDLLCQV